MKGRIEKCVGTFKCAAFKKKKKKIEQQHTELHRHKKRVIKFFRSNGKTILSTRFPLKFIHDASLLFHCECSRRHECPLACLTMCVCVCD